MEPAAMRAAAKVPAVILSADRLPIMALTMAPSWIAAVPTAMALAAILAAEIAPSTISSASAFSEKRHFPASMYVDTESPDRPNDTVARVAFAGGVASAEDNAQPVALEVNTTSARDSTFPVVNQRTTTRRVSFASLDQIAPRTRYCLPIFTGNC